ncbi:MAG: FAD-dependent oxidoreductase [Nitrososphaerota archaeon]|nr:FAD-dependent oxidoreductase [Nitrososphaerota archaeon]
MRVCIVGAGKAGAEAAREACLRGASVTVLDAKGAQPFGERLRTRAPLGDDRAPWVPSLPDEVDVETRKRVVAVSEGSAVTSDGTRVQADAFVIAVGSVLESAPFPGWRKRGVTVMDSAARYEEVGAADSERVVVAGEGERGFQLAGKLVARTARLLVTSWQSCPPTAQSLSVLADAAASAGVTFASGILERALGAERLEAILAGGRVFPAGLLAYVPRLRPRPLPGVSEPSGGVRVGLDTRSSRRDVLAAGGCAEACGGLPKRSSLDQEEGASGRVAGANATGASFTLPRLRARRFSAFGLTWTRIGEPAQGAGAPSTEAATFGERWDELTSCSIVYERRSGTVLGIETVESSRRPPFLIPSGGRTPTLKSLAYDGSSGSTDISMVSETARMGLKAWSRY